jgi:hypothetical protein
VAECARLESVYRETYRGFKSRILRHFFRRAASPLTSSGVLPRLALSLDFDADVLALKELVNTRESAFSAKPALLEPAKRRCWI